MNSVRQRNYTLGRRAENQRATRLKIVQAAVDLHGTVGPAKTTISAIAARAGVQRHTVYRHFPNEPALFQACTDHFLSSEPPPDTAKWVAIKDHRVRLENGLSHLYGYYQRHQLMIANVLRDSAALPVGAGFRALHANAARALTLHGSRTPNRQVIAIVYLATDFQTWEILDRAGLRTKEAARVMADVIRCL